MVPTHPASPARFAARTSTLIGNFKTFMIPMSQSRSWYLRRAPLGLRTTSVGTGPHVNNRKVVAEVSNALIFTM